MGFLLLGSFEPWPTSSHSRGSGNELLHCAAVLVPPRQPLDAESPRSILSKVSRLRIIWRGGW